MGRQMVKASGNSMSFAANALPAKLNGAGQISMHCWFSVENVLGTVTDQNALFWMHFSGSAAQAAAYMNIQASVTPISLRVIFRSSSTSDLGTASCTTPILNPSGALTNAGWWAGGGSVDYKTQVVKAYLNGKNEGTSTFAFASSSFVSATPTITDGLGCDVNATTSTGYQFPGTIAEFAIWKTDIGADGFAKLAMGFTPLSVCPDMLVAYVPLAAGTSPENDIVGGLPVTIAGSVLQSRHPSIRMQSTQDHMIRRAMGVKLRPHGILY